MKTDPENADYTVEKGASRNYEPWREKDRDKAEAVAQREEEERGNAMKVCCGAVPCPTSMQPLTLILQCALYIWQHEGKQI